MSESLPFDPKRMEWGRLMDEALTLPPGSLSNFNRFYRYSFGNQVLLALQGVSEPVNTYKRWAAMERQVKRGSKAKTIMVPMFRNLENDKGELERRLTGYRFVNCLFTVSETEGDTLPEWEPPTWSRERALGALAITEVPFESLDGDTAGYSYERNLAINPVAVYPLKTTMHEMAHIVTGHTTGDGLDEYRTHRGLMEFEAEGSAYLVMNEIQAPEHTWDPAESRAYIRHWLRGDTPPDHRIQRVFKTVDQILVAGRETVQEGEDDR